MLLQNKLLLDLYEGSQSCNVSEFNEHGLRCLKKLVAFDSAVIADLSASPDRGVAIQTCHLHETPLERLYDRARTVGPESIQRSGAVNSQDVTLAKAFATRGHSVYTDIIATSRDPQVLSYCKKYETAHTLAYVSARSFGVLMPTLGLWRATRRNPYTGESAERANLFIPHLLGARAINQRFTTAGAGAPASGATVVAALNGQACFVDPGAITLLQSEWTEWTPPFLPSALLDTVRSAKARAYSGKRIDLRAEVRQTLLILHITEKKKPGNTLTPAEYSVAALAARGLQYKEIARQLGIAPATVRNQLHAVYRKLGVANKTALANVLDSLPGA